MLYYHHRLSSVTPMPRKFNGIPLSERDNWVEKKLNPFITDRCTIKLAIDSINRWKTVKARLLTKRLPMGMVAACRDTHVYISQVVDINLNHGWT